MRRPSSPNKGCCSLFHALRVPATLFAITPLAASHSNRHSPNKDAAAFFMVLETRQLFFVLTVNLHSCCWVLHPPYWPRGTTMGIYWALHSLGISRSHGSFWHWDISLGLGSNVHDWHCKPEIPSGLPFTVGVTGIVTKKTPWDPIP